MNQKKCKALRRQVRALAAAIGMPARGHTVPTMNTMRVEIPVLLLNGVTQHVTELFAYTGTVRNITRSGRAIYRRAKQLARLAA